MVNAVRKAMTIPMPIKARGFMPVGDLIAAGNPATKIRLSRELVLQLDQLLNFAFHAPSGFTNGPKRLVRVRRQAVVGVRVNAMKFFAGLLHRVDVDDDI